jgi:DNA modification methylase
MPESIADRPTKAHEYLFLLAKQDRYYYDAEAIMEKGSGRSAGNRTYKYAGLPGYETKQGILSVANKVWDKRNRRSVWTVPSQPFAGAHFATFPSALVEPCVLAGSRPGDTVLDPFMGSGTTAQVASLLGRQFIGCEINPEYIALQNIRCTTVEVPK